MTMRTLREIKEEAVRKVETIAIKKVLKFTRGKKTEAAKILDVDYKTLLTKIKQYDL
ncbi:MAG: hypothetical protein HQK96_01670 [Nitrospirae bacterium]|nr:hypothetical protein [Nitrospirota bacterium]